MVRSIRDEGKLRRDRVIRGEAEEKGGNEEGQD